MSILPHVFCQRLVDDVDKMLLWRCRPLVSVTKTSASRGAPFLVFSHLSRTALSASPSFCVCVVTWFGISFVWSLAILETCHCGSPASPDKHQFSIFPLCPTSFSVLWGQHQAFPPIPPPSRPRVAIWFGFSVSNEKHFLIQNASACFLVLLSILGMSASETWPPC